MKSEGDRIRAEWCLPDTGRSRKRPRPMQACRDSADSRRTCSGTRTTRTRSRKIASRIVAGFLPFSKAEKRALKHGREYICSEYVFECYKTLGIEIEHDRRGFVAPADFARATDVELVAVLKSKS